MKYAKKMEYLALVRDGSDGGKLEKGYWTCNVTGVEAGASEITPLYHTLYSAQASDFVSENRELHMAISAVSGHTGNREIWVIDRGGDRGNLYARFLSGEEAVYHTFKRRPETLAPWESCISQGAFFKLFASLRLCEW